MQNISTNSQKITKENYESESEQREAQVNLTEVGKDPNQSSEEPPLALPKKASPGA
jgi:hypothetical protein